MPVHVRRAVQEHHLGSHNQPPFKAGPVGRPRAGCRAVSTRSSCIRLREPLPIRGPNCAIDTPGRLGAGSERRQAMNHTGWVATITYTDGRTLPRSDALPRPLPRPGRPVPVQQPARRQRLQQRLPVQVPLAAGRGGLLIVRAWSWLRIRHRLTSSGLAVHHALLLTTVSVGTDKTAVSGQHRRYLSKIILRPFSLGRCLRKRDADHWCASGNTSQVRVRHGVRRRSQQGSWTRPHLTPPDPRRPPPRLTPYSGTAISL
jgi:hypothetical protein